jgi:hypothetical protein
MRPTPFNTVWCDAGLVRHHLTHFGETPALFDTI